MLKAKQNLGSLKLLFWFKGSIFGHSGSAKVFRSIDFRISRQNEFRMKSSSDNNQYWIFQCQSFGPWDWANSGLILTSPSPKQDFNQIISMLAGPLALTSKNWALAWRNWAQAWSMFDLSSAQARNNPALFYLHRAVKPSLLAFILFVNNYCSQLPN